MKKICDNAKEEKRKSESAMKLMEKKMKAVVEMMPENSRTLKQLEEENRELKAPCAVQGV